jgi:hypothetical protein
MGNETRRRDLKNRDRSIKNKIKKSPLAREVKNSMNGKFKQEKILNERSFLDEKNLINDE